MTEDVERGITMEKKIEDMTLKEVAEICGYTGCEVCRFHDGSQGEHGCRLNFDPCDWDLSNKRKVCAKDLERLKAIRTLFPMSEGVFPLDDISVINHGMADGKIVVFVPCGIFLELKDCRPVWFKDVEGME